MALPGKSPNRYRNVECSSTLKSGFVDVVNQYLLTLLQVLLSLNVKLVVLTKNTLFAEHEMDRYAVPQEMGILKQVQTESDYTTEQLMQSIVGQQEQLEEQNRNRVQKAKQYVDTLEYVQETTK